ncbi:DUF4832 domain-containing protein [Specibacter sp. NPDC057265]|uniref:DUF4832 domain-containing protein n=1 Tax=Specibacter sp. NPDC057265 TaxID=3346075 RepID=UPI003632B8C7
MHLDTLEYRLRRSWQCTRLSTRVLVISMVALALLTVPAAAGFFRAEAAGKSGEWTVLEAGAAPASNPLAGFVPYAGSYEGLPHSMEWFYFPVNSVLVAPQSYDWSSFEAQLNEIAGRGHQAVFRFYLDYPGKASGIPQHLLAAGLDTHHYPDYDNHGLSLSPDYEDPRLLDALDGFIAALGARYDGDPRIGFVQMGLLGFWGEWHSYPYDGWAAPENWGASATTQQRILLAYDQAFAKTKLQVRYPDAANKDLNVGYHDDSFAVGTLPGPGWHFMDKLAQTGAADKWLKEPVGGELRPEIQHCIFDTPQRCPLIEESAHNDFAGSAHATHASWILNQHAFNPGYAGQALANATAASQALGYRFQATRFVVSDGGLGGQGTLSLAVSNTGVAPFYYDWPVEVAAAKAGNIVRVWKTGWRISELKTDMSIQWDTPLDGAGLTAGDYTLLVRIVNPLDNGVPVKFANASQDQTQAGWLTLGSRYLAGR